MIQSFSCAPPKRILFIDVMDKKAVGARNSCHCSALQEIEFVT